MKVARGPLIHCIIPDLVLVNLAGLEEEIAVSEEARTRRSLQSGHDEWNPIKNSLE